MVGWLVVVGYGYCWFGCSSLVWLLVVLQAC